MKAILIEAVANGWLVRPFSPSQNWAYGPEACNLFVFTRLEDLQTQLPELLRYEGLTAREARAREMASATLVDAPTCKQAWASKSAAASLDDMLTSQQPMTENPIRE